VTTAVAEIVKTVAEGTAVVEIVAETVVVEIVAETARAAKETAETAVVGRTIEMTREKIKKMVP